MAAMQPTPAAQSDAAMARYEGYLRLDPGNATLRVALADLYHRAGRTDDARACLQACLDADPGHAVARGRLASVLITQHHFAEAEAQLRMLAQAAPVDAALLHNLGLSLYCQGRWADALDAFLNAQALGFTQPATAAANLAYLTHTHHQLGDTASALKTGQLWAGAGGGDTAEGTLALVEMDHGDMAAAHQRAAAVLARDPTNADAAIVEGMWCTETQDIETAKARFDGVARAQPDNARAWLGLGLAHLYEEHSDEAIAALQTATQLMPRHAATLTMLGWARFVSRDMAGAEKTFRDAMALDRGFAEAHGGLAITLVFLKRYAEARRQTRIALRLNPGSFGAVYAHGALMAVDGKRAQGEALVARGLQRTITSDGRSLIDHLQVNLRRQIARGQIGKKGSPPP